MKKAVAKIGNYPVLFFEFDTDSLLYEMVADLEHGNIENFIKLFAPFLYDAGFPMNKNLGLLRISQGNIYYIGMFPSCVPEKIAHNFLIEKGEINPYLQWEEIQEVTSEEYEQIMAELEEADEDEYEEFEEFEEESEEVFQEEQVGVLQETDEIPYLEDGFCSYKLKSLASLYDFPILKVKESSVLRNRNTGQYLLITKAVLDDFLDKSRETMLRIQQTPYLYEVILEDVKDIFVEER